MIRVFGMCFDRRVLFVIAAAGISLWIAAPQAVAAVLPFLLLLACPLSMIFMMRGMGDHAAHGVGQVSPSAPHDQLAALEVERARIDAAIARTRAESTAPASVLDHQQG